MNLFDLRLISEKPQRLQVERIGLKRPSAQKAEMNARKNSIWEKRSSGVNPTTGASALFSASHNSQSDTFAVSYTNGAQGGEPVGIDEKCYHLITDFNETSITISSPVGFEELEEEEDNVGDYLESYILQEKSKPKSRSMQTSEGSSSSCGAEYSSCSCMGQPGAVEESSKTSEENSDTLNISHPDDKGHDYQPLYTPQDIKSSDFSPTGRDYRHLSTPQDTKSSELSATVQHKTNLRGYININPLPSPESKSVRKDKPRKLVVNEAYKDDLTSHTLSVLNSSQYDTSENAGAKNNHDVNGAYDVSKNTPCNHEKPEMVSVRTSTHEIGPCFCSGTNFYHRGEQIDFAGRKFYCDSGDVVLTDLRYTVAYKAIHINLISQHSYFAQSISDIKSVEYGNQPRNRTRDRRIKIPTR
ncbi:hypothetical protein ElyMa_002702000 [Elysia marginata]|uniref:Uncharacterized protein n=1 Tax=Elysia marginata TaxID=1093978 RepID=A0AAV4HFW4_9GAST|nr:hypothetical protein ElyMa_002702000 [Elysia marginata]